MFTAFDKAWLAGFFGPMAVYMAEGVLSGDAVPLEVITDPNKWLMALATAVLVYAIPNKGATYQ